MTKKFKILYKVFSILGFCLSTLPIIVYAGISFGVGGTVTKVVLSLGFITGLILALVSVLRKINCKSLLWVLLLVIYFTLNSIVSLLIITAIGNMLEEFIFTPLAKHYKSRYIINKEIDARGKQ